MTQFRHGPVVGEGGVGFSVWGPTLDSVELVLNGVARAMNPAADGYHQVFVEGAGPGDRYRFLLPDGSEAPDPASRFQPEGVHGESEVIGAARGRKHGWRGLPLEQYVIYELHVGTFTPEGTFDAVIPKLDQLRDLGVTAIELMPVAQFPGGRNWGYDGVFPFAAQNTYGGPDGLLRLVDAIHGAGMDAILDVVYNHIGPEGNVFGRFGPWFSDRHKTLWGPALNFDGPWSDGPRRFFVENALWWLEVMRFDALRLDAIHAIVDTSAVPILEELAIEVDALRRRSGRLVHLIAESDLSDPRVVRPRELGGWGMDAQWADEGHHAVWSLITGERAGIKGDFGRVADAARAWETPFVYEGQYSSFRKRRHGGPAAGLPARRFVVCAQNHDQVGNRMLGERLTTLAGFEARKLAAAWTLLSPYLPLIFMGEERGETAPFLYFISHEDPDLVEAVRNGRREEFREYQWMGEAPDPQSELTFHRSRIQWDRDSEPERTLTLGFYRALIALRRELGPPLEGWPERPRRAWHDEAARVVVGWDRRAATEILVAVNFSESMSRASFTVPSGVWLKRFDTALERWSGPGSPAPDPLTVAEAPAEFHLAAQSLALWLRKD